MALPNKPLGELKAVKDPEVEEREVDILIVGGGMAACGTAFEIKKWASDKKILLVAQKNAGQDDPERDDIYRVGTLSTILQMLCSSSITNILPRPF